jgi:ribonuclease HII
MRGRTWRKGTAEGLAGVRELLLKHGATEDKGLKNPYELWRVRIEDTVFTGYRTGSIYCNGGKIPELPFLYQEISKLLDQVLEVPGSNALIGLDETGKGEVLGHAALAAVRIDAGVLRRVEAIVGSIDTKKRKEFAFWDKIIKELDGMRGHGLEFEVETIPPWDVDRFNMNRIQDVVYQRLLGRILRGVDSGICRIIVDDYGVGKNLGDYLGFLHKAGAAVTVQAKADENYTEVRAAAIVAKWRRELAMKRINEKFSFPDTPVGSGNAGDPLTVAWLARWKSTNQPWPWFVKTSFSTIRKLDGKTGRAYKEDPPIRHELLSEDSARSFREGTLSTASLTVVCPSCGSLSAACKLTPEPTGELVGRCVGCNEIIWDLDTTLRYYCGSIIPDADVIIAGVISKDLDRKGFFGGFGFLLHPVVRKETDTPGGKSELARLGDFAAMGRIGLDAISGLLAKESFDRDTIVIEAAKLNDSILLTRDKGMYGNAVAAKVFCLTMRT